jgi:hypothetical protein
MGDKAEIDALASINETDEYRFGYTHDELERLRYQSRLPKKTNSSSPELDSARVIWLISVAGRDIQLSIWHKLSGRRSFCKSYCHRSRWRTLTPIIEGIYIETRAASLDRR